MFIGKILRLERFQEFHRISFREFPIRKTLLGHSFAAELRNKRKTAERLNAAYSAENSRLIAEHGSAGVCLENTLTRLGAG